MEPRTPDIAALLSALREGHLDAATVGELLAGHPELRAGVEAALGGLSQRAPGGMIFNGPVSVSGGHLGPVWNVTVERLILSLAPRIHKTIALIYARTQHDLPLVEREVQRLRQDGFVVDFDPTRGSGDALSDDDKASLAEAEQVYVFWSVEARRDPRVAAEIAEVRQVDLERAQGRAAGLLCDSTCVSRTGRFVITRLDDAVLSHELALDPELPSWGVMLGIGLVLAGLGWAKHQGWPLGWGQVLAGAVGVGLLLLAGAQTMRRGDRVLRAATVHGWGAWLDQASAQQILALSDQILNRIFGEKILSWRSVRISGALSLLTVVPLAVIWGGLLGQGGGSVIGFAAGGLLSLFFTLPLALTNVVMDFLALGLGRALLRRLVRDGEHGARLALGLLGEAILVLGTGAAVLCSNLAGLLWAGVVGDSIWAWPAGVARITALALAGGLAWSNLHRATITSIFLLTGFAVLTGAFPALVHGSLLLVAGLNRLLGRQPLRLSGEGLMRAADTPHGPWTFAAPVAASLAVGLLVGPLSGAPPELLPDEKPPRIPLRNLCDQGCTIGSPKDEEGHNADETERRVSFGADIQMMRGELTQARWAQVWRAAATVSPNRYGLPMAPSTFIGNPLPVEGVSWCEAARFANLRTQVELEGVAPAYTVTTAGADDNPYALAGCETGAEIRWDHTSTAWRLPTEAEWEVAARGGDHSGRWWPGEASGLLAAEWLGSNADWRTHAACTAPGASAHPLGLCDILGNVQEWTWDFYLENPSGGPDPAVSVLPAGTASMRVVRGGSWNYPPPDARAAGRDGSGQGWRGDVLGFRLVRSVVPSPSGSGP